MKDSISVNIVTAKSWDLLLHVFLPTGLLVRSAGI